MKNTLTTEVAINANPAEVWKALTTPSLIREYQGIEIDLANELTIALPDPAKMEIDMR